MTATFQIQYLVRCAHCDRAFWQRERDETVPAHRRWERSVSPDDAARTGEQGQCEGSARPGYWIGEGEGGIG